MIIPVRVHAGSPLTLIGGARTLAPDHPLADYPCPVCDTRLADRATTLVFVGIDPDTRAQGKTYCTGSAVAVHADCAGLAPEAEHEATS